MDMIRHRRKRRDLIKGVSGLGLLGIFRRALSQPEGAVTEHWSQVTYDQVARIVDALDAAGQPFPVSDHARIVQLLDDRSPKAAAELAGLLDRQTILSVRLNAHGVGVARPGSCDFQLEELGWRSFIVRVENPHGATGPMVLISRSAIAEGSLQPGVHDAHLFGSDTAQDVTEAPLADSDYDPDGSQWLGYRFGPNHGLQGAAIEYQLIQIYSEARGTRLATLSACLASVVPVRRTECINFSHSFECRSATTLKLRIRDMNGTGVTACLLVTDAAGRVYPPPAHRIEPDLGYQWTIYRADGESLRLAAGKYRLRVSRGPEYLQSVQEVVVSAGTESSTVTLQLRRWIDPSQFGWYSGEPHIHPEGQNFAAVSRLGLLPETILRQVRGEGLNIGCVLVWAGGYYYERPFLTGHVYSPTYELPFVDLQRAHNVTLQPVPAQRDVESLIRYDIEQAAFPSNRLGHPILLRLPNHSYPGGRGVSDWPSWNLPVLQWARARGGVCGYAHVGHSLFVNSSELPNYEIPPLDGLGANECLVDVAHGHVDFLAGGESRPVADLNVWYHLLNCGFALPMIGETDFPVGAGTRVMGTVRTYVKLDGAPRSDAGYDAWVAGIQAGRVYFGDGRSHLLDVRINGARAGDRPLALERPGRVTLAVSLAAFLEEKPLDPDADPNVQGFAYWHIERGRIGASRRVPLEVIVNGQVTERREITADGQIITLSLPVQIRHSSWIAVRILPSVHSAPIVVVVGGKPVRVSRRSANWCAECIDVLWRKLSSRIRDSERAPAAAAWEVARKVYTRIASECVSD